MKTFHSIQTYLFLAGAVLLAGVRPVMAEGFHFTPAEIPDNEVRLMELARVREFRIAYELGEACPQSLLVAELHTFGQPVRAFPLARAVYARDEKTAKGTISLGWHRDARQLVSVHDNGRRELYSPFTAKIDLPGFSPQDGFYFRDSVPEERTPQREGMKFQLYPVAGLCGERNALIRTDGVKDAKGYLAACEAAGAKQTVVVYLYRSENGESPAMKFE